MGGRRLNMNAPADPFIPNEADPGPEQLTYLNVIAQDVLGWEQPKRHLLEALQHNRFLLLAQKMLPLKPECPPMNEVLLRLQEEEDNLLPPGGFFPIAENYGLMGDIDRWVVVNLLTWCAVMRERQTDRQSPVYGVNLSSTALDGPQFARFVRAELERSKVPPGTLCFEIPEGDVLARPDAVRSLIAALKPAGCRFTLDAFGSVKVSFTHVKGLPFDFIKVDGVLVQNMLKSAADRARMEAIQRVCGRTGIRTIAEFVETDETLAVLREIGIDYAQGFGVARPAPIAEVV